jgi:hypothetical protein
MEIRPTPVMRVRPADKKTSGKNGTNAASEPLQGERAPLPAPVTGAQAPARRSLLDSILGPLR